MVVMCATVLFAAGAYAPMLGGVPRADAAITAWQKGANITPRSSSDYASESFKASLRNLRAAGATHVGLVAAYYQTSLTSSDIYRSGPDTPTDAALIEAIRYAHSIGLEVTVRVRAEAFTNEWRGYINPNDKAAWFQNYGNLLVRIAGIAEREGVENVSIGAEMVTLANRNTGQTDRWVALINRVRSVYNGNITYEANSSRSDPNDWVSNEKAYVGFWPSVDFISISAYFTIPGDAQGSVASFVSSWRSIDTTHLRPFYEQYRKPIVFSEVGYRSITDGNLSPFNSWRSGSYDGGMQARLYEALLTHWKDSSYMKGVYWWDWKSDPNAGGQGNTDYTPQRKPAEAVVRQFFPLIAGAATSTDPDPSPNPEPARASFAAALLAPSAFTAGQSAALRVSARSDVAVPGAIIDYEIYDTGGRKIFQRYFSGQNFTAGETKEYVLSWTPPANGTYILKMGAFTSTWGRLYTWQNAVATITVGTTGTPGVITVVSPSEGAAISGTQTFKARLGGYERSQYTMYWRVDNGQLNVMRNSADGLNKEAVVSVRNWTWRSSRQYTVTFVARNSSGATLGTQSVVIRVP